MVNTRLLKGHMIMAGYTQRSLAPLLGISKGTLNAKLNNNSEFTMEEEEKLCQLLALSPADRLKTFRSSFFLELPSSGNCYRFASFADFEGIHERAEDLSH